MENTEEVLAALGQFTKEPATDIPQLLDDYLEYVSKSGYTQFPWVTIKPLFKVKLENVISEFIKLSPASSVPVMPNVEPFNLEEMKTRIWDQFESYDGIPFTIQRLCELLTTPTKNYKRIDKFLRGLEKVMLVVSTIEPKPLPAEMSNGVSLETSASGSSSSSTSQDLAAAGSRRLGDSLESPAKRMRLSIEEDGGPCDSADQLPTPVQESSPPGNECIPAAGPLAEPVIPSTSSSPQGEGSGESMEIDAECTSRQARLELSSGDKSADSAAKLADEAKAEETGNREAAPEESKQGEHEDMKEGDEEDVYGDSDGSDMSDDEPLLGEDSGIRGDVKKVSKSRWAKKECENCGYKATTDYGLRLHSLTNHGVLPARKVVCSECPFSSITWRMKMHEIEEGHKNVQLKMYKDRKAIIDRRTKGRAEVLGKDKGKYTEESASMETS